jgi:hypothetical protein
VNGSKTECAACEPGYYSEDFGANICSPCPVGHFAANSASSKCSRCPSTFYNPLSGQSSCILCPENSVAMYQGAIELTECNCNYGISFYQLIIRLSNSVGYYGDNGGICTPCPVGGICNNIGTKIPQVFTS